MPSIFAHPSRVKPYAWASVLFLIAGTLGVSAQSQFSSSVTTSTSASFSTLEAGTFAGGSSRPVPVAPANWGMLPFSRVALGADVSPLGIGLSATTNVNRHVNIRGNGSFLNYTTGNFSTQGFNLNAKINLASARASVDYYPFHMGLRFSPGVMFHNDNQGSFNMIAQPGQSFSLNGYTYYSASGANAVKGLGTIGLGNGRTAFTATTGWGNSIPASGRHISFPFELGVAFTHPPTLGLTLSGLECNAQGQYCVDVATDPTVQTNLAAQLDKYRNDIEPLKTYPIASFGMAYNFSVRRSNPLYR